MTKASIKDINLDFDFSKFNPSKSAESAKQAAETLNNLFCGAPVVGTDIEMIRNILKNFEHAYFTRTKLTSTDDALVSDFDLSEIGVKLSDARKAIIVIYINKNYPMQNAWDAAKRIDSRLYPDADTTFSLFVQDDLSDEMRVDLIVEA